MTIAVESPLQDDVRALVAALTEWSQERTPHDTCHQMTVEQMAHPDTTVFVARDEGKAVAIGALRRHADGVAEVKRMFTDPDYRGHGLGARIVREVEKLARAEGFTRLVLETGPNFDAARHVYARAGFTECGPVLGYDADPAKVFYEKTLYD